MLMIFENASGLLSILNLLNGKISTNLKAESFSLVHCKSWQYWLKSMSTFRIVE